jgi:short chain dehydrogenase
VARVFITGSSDGLGLLAARLLIGQGHEILLHARNEGRSRDALAAAPGALGVVSGDLSTIAGARTVAEQVNKFGRFDAAIHNAGVGYRERRVEMGARYSKPVRCQRAGALRSDRVDRKTESIGLCELRHAPRRASAYGRFALDQTNVRRRDGLRREQAMRCFAGLCRRSPLEGRQIQRAGARMGSDKDGWPFSAGRSSSGLCHPGVACHE